MHGIKPLSARRFQSAIWALLMSLLSWYFTKRSQSGKNNEKLAAVPTLFCSLWPKETYRKHYAQLLSTSVFTLKIAWVFFFLSNEQDPLSFWFWVCFFFLIFSDMYFNISRNVLSMETENVDWGKTCKMSSICSKCT